MAAFQHMYDVHDEYIRLPVVVETPTSSLPATPPEHHEVANSGFKDGVSETVVKNRDQVTGIKTMVEGRHSRAHKMAPNMVSLPWVY